LQKTTGSEEKQVAPTERVYLPFRWEFVPIQNERDKSICWKWRAYAQSGVLVGESKETFDTITGCIDDARSQGYRPAGE
jgi:hypothetical protein